MTFATQRNNQGGRFLAVLTTFSLCFGILVFLIPQAGAETSAIKTLVATGSLNPNVTSDIPNWSDPIVQQQVKFISDSVFASDATTTPYARLSTKSTNDQILLTQALQPARGEIKSQILKEQKPNGSGLADCIQIKTNYFAYGPTNLTLFTYPGFQEVCVANNQIVAFWASSPEINKVVPNSLWTSNNFHVQVTGGGQNQGYVELTTQARYRLCVASSTAGCVNQYSAAYKVVVSGTGNYEITPIQVPNPNQT